MNRVPLLIHLPDRGLLSQTIDSLAVNQGKVRGEPLINMHSRLCLRVESQRVTTVTRPKLNCLASQNNPALR